MIILSRFPARISFPACALIISTSPAVTSAPAWTYRRNWAITSKSKRDCPNLQSTKLVSIQQRLSALLERQRLSKDITSGGCYLKGNKDLDPEISINKEIGLEFAWEDYYASVTYFRNDYQNKIVAGDNAIGQTASGAYILQWQNGGKALVDGIEASMAFPLVKDRLNWNTNATWMITSEQKTPVTHCRSSRNIQLITRLTGPSPRRFPPASTGRYTADKTAYPCGKSKWRYSRHVR